MQRIGNKSGLAGWRRKSPVRLAFVLLMSMALVQTALGQITNTVTANGNFGPLPVTAQAVESVSVASAVPAMSLVKTGTLNDDDGTPGLSAGDSIAYTVTAENTGNITLTGISLIDPLVALALTGGDTGTAGEMSPGEIWTYSGSYAILQSDIDGNGGGDGDIDNIVTASSNQLPDTTASAQTPLNPNGALDLEKSVVSLSNPYPGIFDIEYLLRATNTGTLTQTNLAVSDDLAAAIAPAVLVGTPTHSLSGFAGSGSANPAFNGGTNTALLQGDVQLAPSASGEIRITARISTGFDPVNSGNTATASGPQLPGPVISDDPGVTPGDPNDTNPAPLAVVDADRDGSHDGDEGPGGDRDGDGIADAQDYDPTGYFYCEADGRILSGGLITVTNLSTGGSQTGIGTSNNITVLADGSSGQYQFHASADAIYRLSYILPPAGIASTTRLPGPALDVTSLLPANPAVLGSGQTGASGLLADFTAAANPFHLDFAIEAGDPAVFNNNIPLTNCGSPQLTASKQIASGPALQGDGRSLLTYALTVNSTGTEPVNDVGVTDNLDAAFGAGNYTIQTVTLVSAPPGFAAGINPFFDGSGNPALLTAGGILAPAQSISIEMTLLVSAPAGNYNNTMTATGTSPVNGNPLPPVDASIGAAIITAPGTDSLVVSKSSTLGEVARGQSVPYTVTIENKLPTARTGVDFVDLVPPGLSYVAGTARIGLVALEPVVNGRELVWTGQTIPANGIVTLTFSLVVGAAVSGPEFTNRAFMRDPSGATVSNIAEAVVRLQIEPVFDCPDIIGRVYDDANRDGYMQDGENGIAGVRLVTARGLLITSDAEGRYHIACPAIPDASIGSNFIVKLDVRTLPQGFAVTSENPATVRLTRGKLAKLNFGAAGLRQLELVLDARSFEGNTSRLKRIALEAIDRLLSQMAQEPSALRITYAGSNGGRQAQQRLDLAESLILGAWKARNGGYELLIETRSVK